MGRGSAVPCADPGGSRQIRSNLAGEATRGRSARGGGGGGGLGGRGIVGREIRALLWPLTPLLPLSGPPVWALP